MVMAPNILLRGAPQGDDDMPLMTMPTRESVDPEVRALWDKCERTYPAFKHLWATQANSPIVFRHVWGQLLELKRRSPVAARHFEIGIVVASTLNRCRYCVSHHAPLAESAGLTEAQVATLARLRLAPLPGTHDFPGGQASRPTTASSSTWRTSWCGAASMPRPAACTRASSSG